MNHNHADREPILDPAEFLETCLEELEYDEADPIELDPPALGRLLDLLRALPPGSRITIEIGGTAP